MNNSKHARRVQRKRGQAKRSQRNRILNNRKRRIAYRLRERVWSPRDEPMLAAGNIHYELAERTRGIGVGGIGAMHRLARKTE